MLDWRGGIDGFERLHIGRRSRWEELGAVADCASYVPYVFGCQVWFPLLVHAVEALTEVNLA